MSIGSPAPVADILMWIKLLATETVVDLSMFDPDCNWPEDAWAMTHSAASQTLASLANHFPNIETLSLCPRQVSHDPFNTEFVLSHTCPALLPCGPWYDSLGHLHRLRHLSVTNGWLSGLSLIALGRLPLLESLDIYLGSFNGFKSFPITDSDLPNDAFSALRRLSLRNIASTEVSEVLDLQKLLRNITELEIDHSITGRFRVFTNIQDWFSQGCLPSLVNAPHLNTLRITEDIGDPDQDENFMISAPAALNAMAQIPLRTVKFRRLTLGRAPLGIWPSAIWPNVTKLILPCQGGSLKELAYFAALPCLMHLEICLDLTSDYSMFRSDFLVSSLLLLARWKPVVNLLLMKP